MKHPGWAARHHQVLPGSLPGLGGSGSCVALRQLAGCADRAAQQAVPQGVGQVWVPALPASNVPSITGMPEHVRGCTAQRAGALLWQTSVVRRVRGTAAACRPVSRRMRAHSLSVVLFQAALLAGIGRPHAPVGSCHQYLVST